jgi:hypothetical protein
MATTTNYSWTTPDDTALVKDGASAIRTLGSSVDTTLKNLNPSTTLGDIEYRSSSANTNTRLAIGTTGQFLTVSGGVPAWGSAAGALTLLSTTTCSGTSTTVNTISQSYKTLYGVIYGLTSSSSFVEANVKLNGDASNHRTAQVQGSGAGHASVWNFNEGSAIAPSDGNNAFYFTIHNYTSSTRYKPYNSAGGFTVWDGASPSPRAMMQGGFYMSNTAITSITVAHTNTATGGTILLYGAN